MLQSSPDILATTKVIIAEVLFEEIYKGAPIYQKIRSFLESNGFVQVKVYQRTPQWRDVLFVRQKRR